MKDRDQQHLDTGQKGLATTGWKKRYQAGRKSRSEDGGGTEVCHFPNSAANSVSASATTLNYPPKGSPDYKAPETATVDEETIGAFDFTASDILDLPAFVGKLRETTRLSRCIVGRLTGGTRTLLARYQGGLDEALQDSLVQDSLVQDLNAIIDGPSIYDETRFRNIELRNRSAG